MLSRIDHLGVAVADLDAAIALYAGHLSLPIDHREIIAEQGVEAVALTVGESRVELLRPLGPETPVGRFLAERGPGLHHVAYAVEDIDAVLARLKADGVRLVDEVARRGLGGTRVAFVHPKATMGVLTELVQPPGPAGGPPRPAPGGHAAQTDPSAAAGAAREETA